MCGCADKHDFGFLQVELKKEEKCKVLSYVNVIIGIVNTKSESSCNESKIQLEFHVNLNVYYHK